MQYLRNQAHLCVSAQQGSVSSSRSQARATRTCGHQMLTPRGRSARQPARPFPSPECQRPALQAFLAAGPRPGAPGPRPSAAPHAPRELCYGQQRGQSCPARMWQSRPTLRGRAWGTALFGSFCAHFCTPPSPCPVPEGAPPCPAPGHLEERAVQQLLAASHDGVLVLELPLQGLREPLHQRGQGAAREALRGQGGRGAGGSGVSRCWRPPAPNHAQAFSEEEEPPRTGGRDATLRTGS